MPFSCSAMPLFPCDGSVNKTFHISAKTKNSNFSRSNSNFSILTPTFSRDGFYQSCFQNPSENSETLLAKQAKYDVEKKLYFEMRTVTESNPEWDFFMSKQRKYADVLPVLAQNKSILHMACT